jgi:hypothetical protein
MTHPTLTRTCVIAAALLASGALAASASAWRHPTRAERVAIARVAKGSPHAGHARVHISRIRVSTVGPWASAVVTIDLNSEPDSAEDVLHELHRRWRLTDHSPGTDGEWCGVGMPRKDRVNLGFPPCAAGAG